MTPASPQIRNKAFVCDNKNEQLIKLPNSYITAFTLAIIH